MLTERLSGFPGAPKSPLTTRMTFLKPSEVATIPTYHVLDTSGHVANENDCVADLNKEKALVWYKNMLTGQSAVVQI